MPIYQYKCSGGHVIEKFRTVVPKTSQRRRIRCPKCGLYAMRDIQGEKVNISASGLGVKGKSSVYWPNKGIAQERVIHNLTPEPVVVRNKDEYRKLLKDTHSREAG